MVLEEFQLRLIPLTADEFGALWTAWQDIARARTEAVIDDTIAAQTKEGSATQADLDRIVTLTRHVRASLTGIQPLSAALRKKAATKPRSRASALVETPSLSNKNSTRIFVPWSRKR